MRTFCLFLFLKSVDGACSPPVVLSPAYLSSLKNGPVISSFIPTAYFQGESVKFISTEYTEIFDENLCVDDQTTASDIQLFDDGTNGDDTANDGIFSRSCVHFCQANYDDIWGFAFERDVYAGLTEVQSNLKGSIPSTDITSPLYPDVVVKATSHAAFFVDDQLNHLDGWPHELRDDISAPTGRSIPVASFLSIFGDVFDYLTVTGLDTNQGVTGYGIYKWQRWERAGGPQPEEGPGDAEDCMTGLTGIATSRLVGVTTAENILLDPGGLMHELIHGVSGFEYQNALDKARSGDFQHVPGACTIDHSQLQATVWDWEKGFPFGVKTSYCQEEEDINGPEPDGFCYYQASDTVRLEANDDCSSCPDDQLDTCCSFRYVEAIGTPDAMMANPELFTMSPIMNYIAGFITFEDMMALPSRYRTFYCMGSDTDGGCGFNAEDPDPEQPLCTVAVDDTNRSAIRTSQVERYTFDDLVNANGGRRDPPLRAEMDLRHGFILLTQRQPSEAELALYTMLMRHHEVENEPHARLPTVDGDRRNPLVTWLYTTQGKSTLHSKLHGIDCGGGLQVPSCSNGSNPCSSVSCGENAECSNLDGRAFCQCLLGFVGDGSLCVLPNETVQYPLATAYELLADDRLDCFGNDWPERITADMIPQYPGGIAPFAAEGGAQSPERVPSGCAATEITCTILQFIMALVSSFLSAN